jgi:hypothetical protein
VSTGARGAISGLCRGVSPRRASVEDQNIRAVTLEIRPDWGLGNAPLSEARDAGGDLSALHGSDTWRPTRLAAKYAGVVS